MRKLVPVTLIWLMYVAFVSAQSPMQATSSSNIVPTLVNYSGRAVDIAGKPVTGIAGITFSVYRDQLGGSPLWFETQNVTADSRGNYTVQLGATLPEGLPLDLFASGEARWLGVRINGGEEQPRTLFLSVPYALKAADAQTLGGLPASAFVLAAPSNSSASTETVSQSVAPNTSTAAAQSPATGNTPVTTAGGTNGKIPLWDSTSDITSSIITQTGSGSSAKLGINIANPLLTLDVNGTELVRGLFEMATTGFATATRGFISNPLNIESSAFSSSASKYTLNHFQWQAEPVGNNTASPGATLNLLYGQDPNPPAETGLKIASNGQFTFAAGQKFPGTGSVTSVGLSAPTSDFTVSGSPVTTSGTLGLAWKVAPTSSNTANAIVKRDSGGNFSTNSVTVSTISAEELFSFNPSGGEGTLSVATGVSGQGVWGESDGTQFFNNAGPDGVHGVSHANNGSGVAGLNDSSLGYGVYGQGNNVGVFGLGGAGIYGEDLTTNSFGIYGIGDNSGSYAGFFVGDVFVSGNLSKGGGSFEIDHPLDPANKYLYHSFVESPDMKNIYDGVALLDANGEAVIKMPEWFGVLNRDFRYQLTCIGGFAPVYIAEELANNQFKIGGGHAGMKVSWQVTGIRQDKWANAHRIPVEKEKDARERGYYLHPELYGAAPEKRIDYAWHPEMLKHAKEMRKKLAVVASHSQKQ
jgi:trimeric autotransporter adhesin